jgi:hypothetical protein
MGQASNGRSCGRHRCGLHGDGGQAVAAIAVQKTRGEEGTRIGREGHFSRGGLELDLPLEAGEEMKMGSVVYKKIDSRSGIADDPQIADPYTAGLMVKFCIRFQATTPF